MGEEKKWKVDNCQGMEPQTTSVPVHQLTHLSPLILYVFTKLSNTCSLLLLKIEHNTESMVLVPGLTSPFPLPITYLKKNSFIENGNY